MIYLRMCVSQKEIDLIKKALKSYRKQTCRQSEQWCIEDLLGMLKRQEERNEQDNVD